MFDSHCHLDADAYAADRTQVLARAVAAGISGILLPARGPDSWPNVIQLCREARFLHGALGLHPWFLQGLTPAQREAALAQLATRAKEPGVVAIGECGLDGVVAKRGGPSLAQQREVLEAQLDIASALSLPVILHCVRAHGMLLELLTRRPMLPRGGVLHSYSGSAELIPRYAQLGLYFGFAGVITREQAKKPRQALVGVPESRLLLESDGPDQPPAGALRSEPAQLPALLVTASQLRDTSPDLLARATTVNACRLLQLAAPPPAAPSSC